MPVCQVFIATIFLDPDIARSGRVDHSPYQVTTRIEDHGGRVSDGIPMRFDENVVVAASRVPFCDFHRRRIVSKGMVVASWVETVKAIVERAEADSEVQATQIRDAQEYQGACGGEQEQHDRSQGSWPGPAVSPRASQVRCQHSHRLGGELDVESIMTGVVVTRKPAPGWKTTPN